MVKARKKKKDRIKELDNKDGKKFFTIAGVITVVAMALIYFFYFN